MKTKDGTARKPYKYEKETFILARQLKEQGKNNFEIGRILGIPHENQVRRILKYPLKKFAQQGNTGK